MEPQVQKLVDKVRKNYLSTPQDQRLCKSAKYISCSFSQMTITPFAHDMISLC